MEEQNNGKEKKPASSGRKEKLNHHKKPLPPRSKGRKGSPKKPKSFFNSPKLNTFLNIFLVGLITYSIFSYINDFGAEPTEISLSSLAQSIEAGEIISLVVQGNSVTAINIEDEELVTQKESDAAITETLINYGVAPEMLRSIEISVERPSSLGYWLSIFLPMLLPLIIILAIIYYLSKQMKGTGMQALNFGQSRARMIDPNDKRQRITFKDVAGVKEAKQELQEIVDFLKNPKKFIEIGAQIPKGVLLMGAPGTGKTLLARAVAGEASVPFFSISGSEFVEMFVGVGASRVRDLFKMAKKVAPAIIFVDEIDAVGRARGAGTGGGNDEREQTLNQILVEMDGFEPNQTVIVMAATNRPDVLDPALLRPGRFDRRVTVDTPDREGREMILKIQARNKPLAADVDFYTIAERTPGFTGADIYSLVNEAAILAARNDKKKIHQIDFIDAIEKVLLGPERRSHLLSKTEKKITAYHEAGHAVVASVLPHTDPVHKITIVSRGHAAGYVLHLPVEEKRFRSRKQFIDDLSVALGGYVTEQLIFDDLTTGPSSDLETVTSRARAMVTRYGMSDKIGPIALETESGSPLFGRRVDGEYSESVATLIDGEVSRLINEAKDKALQVIKENRTLLDKIAERLMEKETIERAEFEEILEAHGITPKKSNQKEAGITIAEDLSEEGKN